jgi:hypothetical protein
MVPLSHKKWWLTLEPFLSDQKIIGFGQRLLKSGLMFSYKIFVAQFKAFLVSVE